MVRSRDVRFLDDATEPDDKFDAASVPTAPIDEDDPVLADATDPLGRTLYNGIRADECSACGDEDTILYSFDYCPLAHGYSCTNATTLAQLTGTWRCVGCRAQDAAVPMDWVQEAGETTLLSAVPRTKWGVSADMDESDVDEQLPMAVPALNGPGLPGATDLHARRREKRTRLERSLTSFSLSLSLSVKRTDIIHSRGVSPLEATPK